MKVPGTSLDPILSGESIRVLPPPPTSLQQLLGQIPLPRVPPSFTPLPCWCQGWGTQPPVKWLAIPWTCRRHLLSLKGPAQLQHQPRLKAAGAWACCGQSYCRHRPCPGPSTLRKCQKGFCLCMERAGKALASLEPGVLKAPADNSQKDFEWLWFWLLHLSCC